MAPCEELAAACVFWEELKTLWFWRTCIMWLKTLIWCRWRTQRYRLEWTIANQDITILSEDQKNSIESPVEIEEIARAIQKMNNNIAYNIIL